MTLSSGLSVEVYSLPCLVPAAGSFSFISSVPLSSHPIRSSLELLSLSAFNMFKALLITAAATALAAPTSVQLETRQQPGAPFQQQLTGWNEGAVSNFPIHSSCNSTQRAQIAAGLNETILLAEHAKEHVLRWGNSSELYQKYFGELPPFQVIGAFDLVVSGDKGGVLFRCDDPDNNCHQDGKSSITRQ